MNKTLKKLLSSLISVSIIAGSVMLPITANAETTPIFEGDTVVKEWKFDFGSADDVAEGYTAVTADRNYVTEGDYGFLGIDGLGHLLGNTLDGFGNQKGQYTGADETLALEVGGGTGLNDGIGSVGEDKFGNAGDKYYPARFALKVEDEQFFRVKATVTTLDPTKDANVTIYTSRKHPIVKNKTVTAGEAYTVEFSIRTTPIYYKGIAKEIADEMVNVAVLGENSALAALEIQQVEKLPVMWVLGDSTVTDGNTTLPFFDQQNYTGVGTGLTMYLPRTMAMVNEGEGGLDAHDNNHYNMVASRIKAGDYMYVEYGHNHKNDGTAGYLSALDKYYNKCHEVGAKLIIVSPIERINQWDSANSVYTQSLNGYADTGEQYVADKVAGGATDIAYVDLNDYSINWYNKITADNGNDANAIKFYFQVPKGGSVDQTHPNDAGAENLAYEFIKAAQAVTNETQKAVLAGFLDDITDETPTLVSEEVIAGGLGGSAWPQYVVEDLPKLPVVINNVTFNEDGTVAKVDVTTREAELKQDAYGIIVITIKDADGNEKGKLYAVNQVDNTWAYGDYEIVGFRGDVTFAEGDTYSAIVMKALDTADGIVVDEEANLAYSAEYKLTDIQTYLLPGQDMEGNATDVENFTYYGQTALTGSGKYVYGGSSGSTLTLGTDDNGITYSTIASDGGGASWFLMRPLENLGDAGTGYTGKYLVSMDMIYSSGKDLTFHFAKSTTPTKSPFIGDNISLFTVGDSGVITIEGKEAGTVSALNWTNVQYILDMDRGTAEVSIGGGAPVVVDVPNFQTTQIPAVDTFKHFVLSGGKNAAFDVKVSNLTVAKLKDTKLPEYTTSVAASDAARGSVSIVEGNGTQGDVTVSYTGGRASVTASKALDATVIVAAYDNAGKLESAVPTKLSFAEAGTQTVDAAEGSRIMVWNSLSGLVPLSKATKAVETEPGKVTNALNTVVTAKAIANKGSVFMGWKDEDGNIVSEDANYTFRVRKDLVLTAEFVKEPGVEEVVSFDLSADTTSMTAEAGETVNISIIGAADSAGTPIASVTEADGTWTCDDAAITVTNGVMTIPEGYVADAAKKLVTVTCVLNGVSKNIKVKLYATDYFEDFTTVANAAAWITDTSTNPLSAIIDTATDNSFAGMTASGNGKAIVIGNNSNGAGKNLAYTRDMGLSDKSVLKFGFDIEPHQIRNDGKNASVTLQFVDTEGTAVFNITVSTSGSNSSFNGAAVNGFTQGTVVSVDTELDFTNKKMKYTLTNPAGTVLASGESDLTANNLDRMYFAGEWQYGKFALDNVYADYE